MTTHSILVFSEERHTSPTICWVLEYKGYRVKSAVGFEAAIEALFKNNFDLVIAEFSNGAGGNLGLLRRAQQLNPKTKIILMCDKQSAMFPWEAYCIEADDYLLLPISPTELWRRVSQCLEATPDLTLGKTRRERLNSLTGRGGSFAQEIPLG